MEATTPLPAVEFNTNNSPTDLEGTNPNVDGGLVPS